MALCHSRTTSTPKPPNTVARASAHASWIAPDPHTAVTGRVEVNGRTFAALPTDSPDCADCAAWGNEAMCEEMPECVIKIEGRPSYVIWIGPLGR